jgi:ubiquinone/menaquinone biosynthesis C-methylase UbiE
VRYAQGCVTYEGRELPYSNGSFELAMAETVLHHAATLAPPLLAEMARVASRYVLVSEDTLDGRASPDVVKAYRR